MPATRQTNTMSEFYGKMLRLIADAKAEPDADLASLIDIETTVLGKAHAPADMGQDQAASLGTAPGPMNGGSLGPGGPPPGMPPGGPGGPGGMIPQGLPPGVPGGGGMPLPGAGMSNPDELRRVLSR